MPTPRERVITWKRSGSKKRRPLTKTLAKEAKAFCLSRGYQTAPEVDPDRVYVPILKNAWVEVVCEPATVKIVTRSENVDVSMLADDFASLVARKHKGDYTPPSNSAMRAVRIEKYLDSDAFYDDPDFD